MTTTTNTADRVASTRHRRDEGTRRLDATRTARIVGALYIVGTVAGILARVAIAPVTTAPDLLGALGDGTARVQIYALGVLAMGAALAAIPLLVYPILRQHSERLALGYVVFRSGFETAGFLAFALFWLLLAFPGRSYLAAAGSGSAQLGAFLRDGHDMIGSGVFTLVFLVGALLFYSVLFRARLVPRWLSGWGLVAAMPVLLTSLLTMLGLLAPASPLQDLVHIPIGVQEMVLAVWLIVKGFDTAAIAPVSDPAGVAPAHP